MIANLTLDDPFALALVIGTGLTLLILLMLIFAIRAARRGAEATEPLAAAIAELGGAVRTLDQGQHQLAGGLKHVSEAQAAAQARMIETMERRLEAVQKSMGESLHGTSQKTTRSLAELQERLAVIDKAQTNIEKLSGDVLSLQDILSNKQARGAFGEIQLSEIVSKALPPDAYGFQATLSNGKRADCLIHLPNPPGPIVIDAKFPLEAYEALRAADTERGKVEAGRAFKTAVQTHIRAIADRYIVPEETADGALMFLPSEAVYAELHAGFGDVVREGFARRVWIVSPTTCMATLNTMRAILKDARMREQAGAIRRELGMLTKDMDRLVDRVGKLDGHFEQARRDVEQIKISASKAGSRAGKLESFEFDEPAPALPNAAE
ncbi:DNA recombination protein RmuC [Pikeienuella piscinae]|uniref:DNA recombination protein RmuC homolog n=1 Tax=Pikeienuella piscinae TaxID=2748098 RepID=A0A7L5BV97_9RHOB|nr:DNA recombination protein RmuC [Pikeienuella piscinae]QIE55765.1 DNA recombination protein RmuC [Pikeienuella piscinae]